MPQANPKPNLALAPQVGLMQKSAGLLDAWLNSRHGRHVQHRHGPTKLSHIIANRQLHAVFQPIASLSDGAVYAHEALIRGPEDSAFHHPDTLFAQANQETLGFVLEVVCLVTICQTWGRMGEPGRLFVNLSANALVRLVEDVGPATLTRLLRRWRVQPRQVVLEITEHERVAHMPALVAAVSRARQHGMAVALDDFGDGRSSLRLWSELRPEAVKIDKYFTKDICTHADKVKTIQALQKIAATFGSELVAEGIETADDMRLLRDLGLSYGQGYFLARPQARPSASIAAEAVSLVQHSQIAVYPDAKQAAAVNVFDRLQIIQAPTLGVNATNEQVAAVFQAHPQLHALPLVADDSPVGLINRVHFLNQYSRLYYREIWGKKPCLQWANLQPRLIETKHSIDDLLGILTSDDQRYLSDGFVVVDNGRYRGLCRGDQIVKSVTETRIEAARHANPLTFLPGNIPITQHIDRLLSRDAAFVVCYLDLNHFKSFNDRYGYWRGDEMIRLVAQTAATCVVAQRDFLGHVGGDDFIVVYQSDDWADKCHHMIATFNAQAAALFDEADRRSGGIEAEDRQGFTRFFPCTTLSIGVVLVPPGVFRNAEQVANAAAAAKHAAKLMPNGLAVHGQADTSFPQVALPV